MASNINGAIPATNDPLTSAPVRGNFATAATEISALQAQLGTTGNYLAIGVPQPSPAPLSGTVTSQQLAVGAVAGQATLGLNLYNDASGGEHYVANGAAAMIDTHAGLTGGALPTLSISVFDFNNAGPGAAASSVGGVQIVYGASGMVPGPYVFLGRGNEVPVTVPRRATLIAGDLCARADPINPGASPSDNVSRLGLNGVADNSVNGAWAYVSNGPAGTVTVHSANAGATPLPAASMRFSVSDESTAGAALENSPKFVLYGLTGTTSGNTNVSLLVNTGTGAVLHQVTVGAANSGGAGFRQLLVQVP